MSPSLPCACAVPLSSQCDPVLHTVDCLVIAGEEAMDVPQFTMRMCTDCAVPLPGQCDTVLHAVDRLVAICKEAMDVPQFTMRMRSTFTWPV